MTDTDTPPRGDTSASFRRVDLAVLVILVVGHAAFNALFAPFGTAASQYPSNWAYPAIGVIGVQPVLFAMWAALGTPSFVKRFPWAVVACVIVAYAQSVRSFCLIARSTASGDPFQAVFLTLGVFFVVTLVLLVIRRVFSCRIQPHGTDHTQEHLEDIQFSVRYLLGWTAASAALLALGRFIAADGPSAPPGSDLKQVTAQITGFLGFFCVLLFPTVAVPWITLTYHRKAGLLVAGALGAWAALTWAAISVLCAVTPSSPSQAIEAVVLVQLGAATAGFVTALPLRLCGFRIRRGKRLSRQAISLQAESR